MYGGHTGEVTGEVSQAWCKTMATWKAQPPASEQMRNELTATCEL